MTYLPEGGLTFEIKNFIIEYQSIKGPKTTFPILTGQQ